MKQIIVMFYAFKIGLELAEVVEALSRRGSVISEDENKRLEYLPRESRTASPLNAHRSPGRFNK